MRVGDIVRIVHCVKMPEVVGQEAEIVDLQMQDYERYRVYPVWVKMLIGKRQNKVYGFNYDEVEVIPREAKTIVALEEILRSVTRAEDINEIERLVKYEVHTAGHKIVKTSLAAEIERIIRDTNTFEEITEIERAIAEAKGRIIPEPALGFWEGKTPCWETFRCPEAVRNECPAFQYRNLPCWQIDGTYSKLHDNETEGECTKICENCRVYKRYGKSEPIEITLHGEETNYAAQVVTKKGREQLAEVPNLVPEKEKTIISTMAEKNVIWANPGALGLAGFGFNTILLQVHNIGWIPATIPLIWGFFWGGAAQVFAGVIEARRGDTFAMTAFISYGFFWIGLGFAFLLEWLGVVTLDGASLAWTMIVWGIFTGYMTLGALKISRVHFFIFTSLTVLFGLLAAHFFGVIPALAAGIEGLFCGGAAVYGSAAVVLNSMYNAWVLPIGQTPRVSKVGYKRPEELVKEIVNYEDNRCDVGKR